MSENIKKIINVVGARPNFMKIAPIVSEMQKNSGFDTILLHTGQHYDAKMSKAFFIDLEMPEPDIYLKVGSGSHAEQTANIMIRFEEVLKKNRPDMVLLVGDVNSTLACSIVAAKLNIQIIHVEAGLRSNDWAMPEEINRIVTDSLSDILFTTCKSADKNLINEGIPENKIYFVGNVMIDSLLNHKLKAEKSEIKQQLGLKDKDYAVLTLHRPSNVDNKENLDSIIKALEELDNKISIVFPVHVRTKANLERLGFGGRLDSMKNLVVTEPMGYLDFLNLVSNSKFVLTDSGGLQEETTVLGVPCLTLRNNTERPITVHEGTNTIVGNDCETIINKSAEILKNGGKVGKTPTFWDGNSAERIVNILNRC